jgi:hypothetical protein
MPARLAAGRGGARLGSAQARWNDYVGTAAADDAAAILAIRSLHEVVSLDRDRWTIGASTSRWRTRRTTLWRTPWTVRQHQVQDRRSTATCR